MLSLGLCHQIDKVYEAWILIYYCYHLDNVINLTLPQIDYIKQLPLWNI